MNNDPGINDPTSVVESGSILARARAAAVRRRREKEELEQKEADKRLRNSIPYNNTLLIGEEGKNNNMNAKYKSSYRQAAFNAARTARNKPNYPAVDPGTLRGGKRKSKTRRRRNYKK